MEQRPTNEFVPFLKWPGGKRWLASLLSPLIHEELKRVYYEPFVGAGAVFLSLRPQKAVLSDINAELMATLKTVPKSTEAVIQDISRFSNDEHCYYRVRSMKPTTDIASASRFIYLNRTCWGGLYRLNRKGEFNVPFGNSGRSVCPEAAMRACAELLKKVSLKCCDFEEAMLHAGKGDVVYADPPYTLRGKNNGFLRYNDKLFSWEDQERMAAVSRRIARRGAFVVISGIWHKDLLELYHDWWASKLTRHSLVSGDVKARRKISELLLFSRKPRCRSLLVERALELH